jgi:hypothetical protein
MAYNLPPAWDAGFALPKNVRDEGLERRAFVTRQLPRGTYDDSTDGTGGYVVPQYVLDEGTGQGAYVTDWQARGTYNGPVVPNWLNKRPTVTQVTQLPGGAQQVTVQPLGDAPMAEPFESYGQQAAAVLIGAVANLPQGQRQKALKAIMDRIDKSLWSRTSDIFNRYVQQKMAPADAFPLALARALSTGIAAEIITTGIRGSAPQAASLLGLGCYGCAAVLGALGDDAPPAGCQAAPAGYTWIYGATVNGQVIPGHWAKLAAGQTAQPFCPTPPPGAITAATVAAQSGITTVVVDHGANYDWFVGPFGFNTATFVPRTWASGSPPSATTANRAAPPDIMYLSPDVNFSLPQPTLSYVRPLIPQVLQWLAARLTEATDSSGKTDTPTTYSATSSTNAASSYLFDANGNANQGMLADAKRWFDAMGIQPGTPVRLHALWYLKTAAEPLARTTNIKTGANMALYVSIAPMDLARGWDQATNPMVLKVWLVSVPDPSLFGALWNPMILINPVTALQATVGVTAGVITAVGDQLGNLACGVLSNPAAGTAAGVAAAAYGIPPQAGTAGVAIAASQCGQAPPPVVVPASSSIWPMVLIGGGALVAILLLTKPKKAATP